MFNIEVARKIAGQISTEQRTERGLAESFAQVCQFVANNPEAVTDTVSQQFKTEAGLKKLANRYFNAYRKPNIPTEPSTVPDTVVDIIMQEVYRYSSDQCEKIKLSHQHAMSAENCVGALLERYLDSVLREHGWNWCCGNMIRAVDFVYKKNNGTWLAMQIKNRDNSENSSSSAIRDGTEIKKWFRLFSKTGDTNWRNFPLPERNCRLDEESFVKFVKQYLRDVRL